MKRNKSHNHRELRAAWIILAILTAVPLVMFLSDENSLTGAVISIVSEVNDSEMAVQFSEGLGLSAVPTHSTPILNTTDLTKNSTFTNLTAYNISTADTDNDLVKNIYSWQVNGSPIAVLYMPFEGGSLSGNATGVANGARDYARNINGTVFNATWNATGGYDGRGAYEFKGRDYLVLPAGTLTNFTSLTFTAWIKPKNGQGTANDDFYIIGGSGTLSHIWEIDRVDNATELLLGGTTAEVDRCSQLGVNNAAGRVFPDRWTHVAITWNNVTGCRYYVNGTLVGSSTTTIGQVSWGGITAPGTFDIGVYRSIGPQGFANGTIDEVMIFNRSLSAQQIHALYNNRTDLIAGQELQVNDVWGVQMTPNDGSADGNTSQSNNVTILYEAPRQNKNIPSINLTVGAHITINLSSYFTGSRYDDSDINFTLPNPALITINISNITKILIINATANGTVIVNITATDGISTTPSNNFTIYIDPAPAAERWSDVFVGPLAGWKNVTTHFGAVGNGTANDTAAFQNALNNLSGGNFDTLYIPAGTYRITNTLRFPKYANESPATQSTVPARIFGEDPNNTTLIWAGGSGQPMIFLNPCYYTTLGRITLDGNRTALSGIQSGIFYGNTCKIHDMVFQDFEYGIEAGYEDSSAFGISDYTLFRNKFLRNTKAGIILSNGNTLEWGIWGSYFEDNNYSITNYFPGRGSSAGAGHVLESVFENSTSADIWSGGAGYITVRDSYSRNSGSFLITSSTNSPAPVTIQRNQIIDSKVTPIIIRNKGPVVVLDNVFRGTENFTGPAILGELSYINTTILSINNTFTVSSQVQATADNNRVRQINDRILPRTAIVDLAPELPPTPPKINPPIFDVPTGASGETIQGLINNATNFSGQRPVVHLLNETYYIGSTLVIPANTDLILMGENWLGSSTLTWRGKDAGPMIRVEGPSNATLIDFTIQNESNIPNPIGLVINGVDQENSKVHFTEVDSTGLIGFLVNGLENASIEMIHPAATAERVGFKVVGSGRNTTSRVNLFTGGVARGLAFDVKNGGWLAVRGFWDEIGYTYPMQFLNLTNSQGNLTITDMMIFHCRSTNPDKAQILVNNFNGTVIIMTTDIRGNCEAQNQASLSQDALDANYRTDPGINIRGDHDNLKFALIGNNVHGANHINNTSPDANVSEIYSTTALGDNYTETADSGDNSSEFLLSMLSQMRELDFIFNRGSPDASNVKIETFRITTANHEGIILSNSFCGNGEIEGGEECDDNNSITDVCAYGQASCTVCNSTCQNAAGDTQTCGDGTCDLNNESSANCRDDCGIVCPSEGIVGWWPGENNASDKFYNNHGITYGDTAFTSGKVSQSFSFDGTGDYVNLDDPYDGTLDFGTKNFTVSFWAKKNDNNDHYVLYKRDSAGIGWAMDISDSVIYRLDDDPAGGSSTFFYTPSINFSNWHHYVGVFDRLDNLKAYLDGNLNYSSSIVLQNGSISGASDLYLGTYSPTSGFFNGSIDEVMLWNRTLNATEVLQIYTAGAAGVCNIPSFANPENTSENFLTSQNFTANITLSNNDLDYYIFSTNASGSWVNKTVDISGQQYNASESAAINLGAGSQACWYYWANNTAGSSAQSATYCFTVQSTSASVGGANSGVGVTAPSTVPSVENAYFTAKAGETSSVSFTQNDVTSIEIVSAADLNSVPVTVEKVSAGSSAVLRAGSISEKVAVYSYLQITAGTDNKNIEKAKINFKIPSRWFAEKYNSDKVILYHYDSSWKPLVTTKAKEDSAYAYYAAETDGFSLFAISAEKIIENKSGSSPAHPEETAAEPAEDISGAAAAEESSKPSFKNRINLAGKAFLQRLSLGSKHFLWLIMIFVAVIISLIFAIHFRKRLSKKKSGGKEIINK